MGKKVPIAVDNIGFERLDLSRHYLTVDCDFTCFLVLNPSGEIPVEGTDICALHTGAWQIDAWKLLTKKDFPNQAGFVACLVWDKTLISDSAHAPQCVESDIDTANSVSSLKGQPVNITGFSMPDGQGLPVVSSPDDPVYISMPDGQRLSVVSSPDEPVYTREHPLYFGSIFVNTTLESKTLELLKTVALLVVPMTNGGFRITLRPSYCRVEFGSAGALTRCNVYPTYVTTVATSTNKGDVLRYAGNQLVLTTNGDRVITTLNYFVSGVSVKNASDTSLHSFSGNVNQIDLLEF